MAPGPQTNRSISCAAPSRSRRLAEGSVQPARPPRVAIPRPPSAFATAGARPQGCSVFPSSGITPSSKGGDKKRHIVGKRKSQLSANAVYRDWEPFFRKGAALADRTKLYSMGETAGIFTLASRWA